MKLKIAMVKVARLGFSITLFPVVFLIRREDYLFCL